MLEIAAVFPASSAVYPPDTPPSGTHRPRLTLLSLSAPLLFLFLQNVPHQACPNPAGLVSRSLTPPRPSFLKGDFRALKNSHSAFSFSFSVRAEQRGAFTDSLMHSFNNVKISEPGHMLSGRAKRHKDDLSQGVISPGIRLQVF